MSRILFVFLISLSFLFAENFEGSFQSTIEGDDSTLIENCVSVISGQLYLNDTDVVAEGKQSIVYAKTYMSLLSEPHYSQITKMSYTDFEDFSHSGWGGLKHLVVYVKYDDPERKKNRRLDIHEPNGLVLSYDFPKIKSLKYQNHEEEKKRKRTLFLKSTKNFHQKKILSAKDNLKNNKVKRDGEHDLEITCSNGTIRHYYRKHAADGSYYLSWERLRNGNKLIYELDGRDIKKIKAISPSNKVYSEIVVNNSINKKTKKTEILTNGNYNLEYSYSHEKLNSSDYRWILNSIKSNRSSETMDYHKQGSFLLKSYSFPNNRVFRVEYHSNKRVSELKDPLNNVTHKFFYDKIGEINKSDGITRVVDANGDTTIYYYNNQLRLDKVEKYQGSNKLLKKDVFIWGKDSKDGFLLGKIFYDDKNVPIKAIRNIYDKENKGNIKKEIIFGNISGNNKYSLILDKKTNLPIENGIETYIKEYTYTPNDLIASIKEPNGLKIEYTYWKDTDLPKTKFLIFNKEIMQRTFYEYNDDNVLIAEIQDDGKSKELIDVKDSTSITGRLIKRITPRTEKPLGLIDTLEELYLDLDTKTLQLLKKEKYEYSQSCKVTKKQVYGSDNKLEYTLEYTYDGKDNLISETDPLWNKAIYKYDENNNKRDETDFFQKESHYEYDLCNRLISKAINGKYSQSFNYDSRHNRTQETDIYGNIKNFEYDALGNLIKEILPKVEDYAGRIRIEYEYDAFSNRTSKKDLNGNITKTAYNTFNKPVSITYPDGTSEKYEYNLNGTLKCYINQVGAETKYKYDYLNRVISKKIFSSDNDLSAENFEYDAFNLIKTTDPEANYTIYKYDGANRKTSEEVFSNDNKLLSTEEIEFDSLGFISKKILGKSLFIHYTRDALGRVEKIEKKNSNNDLLYLQEDKYEHDKTGYKNITISYVNNDNFETCDISTKINEHDELNRLIKQTDTLGNSTIINYIDKNEKIVEKINPLSQRVKTTYDTLGREKIIEHINPDGKIVSLEEKCYDLNGNLIKQISTIYHQFDPMKKIITTWVYDNMNRVISFTEADRSDFSKTTGYTYNKLGLLEKTIKPDENEITNEYDEIGRKTRTYSSEIDYIYEYNKLNQLIEARDVIKNIVTKRSYDPLGNLVSETLSNGLTINSEYDLLQNRTKCIYPDNSYVEYTYNPINLTKIIRKDIHGKELYSHKYLKYDLSLNLMQEELIDNAGFISYELDSLSRITTIKTPYHKQTAEYDEMGRISNIRFEGFCDDSCNYTYDDLNQLNSETGLFSNNYEFDSNYNRLQKNSNSYQINDLNQITSNQEEKFDYDPNGNPLKQTTKDAEISYEYDSLDRLIKIEKPNDYILEFTYDPFNRRTSKRTQKYYEEDFRYFLYDDLNEIGSFDENLNQKELRILSDTQTAEIGSAISFEIEGVFGRYYYAPIYDISQNVISLIYNGSLYEHYRYSAFGERKIFSSWGLKKESSQVKNPWQFSSKRIDEESQLVFFGRRYYNPKLGRWLTCDPKGFVDGLNLYAFVLNDPLIKVDLYGLFSLKKEDPRFLEPIGNPGKNSPIYLYNGINNPEEDVIENAHVLYDTVKHLSKEICIIPGYSGSKGLLIDGLSTLLQRNRLYEPKRVRVLRQQMIYEANRLIESKSPQKAFFVTFSRGTLDINQATERLTPEQRNMIIAINLGFVKASPESFAFVVRNIRSSADLIPKIMDAYACCGIEKTGYNSIAETDKFKVMTIPRSDGRFFSDHNFSSRTYQDSLKDQLNSLYPKYGIYNEEN